MSGSIVMNTFRQDPFSGVTLTDQINKFPYVPQFLGQLNIFEDEPIRTTALQVDERDGTLTLIPTTPRGAPLPQRVNDNRKARYFGVPRIAKEDTIHAAQLQNIRSDNPGQLFKTLIEEVARRLTGPTGLTMHRELTLEYHRLGAVQGILLDANGQPLYNWFNEFGITPTPEWAFNLAAKTEGTIRPICNQISRTMKRKSGGAFIENYTEVHALCGDSFFDAFTTHPDVEKTFANWNAAPALREGGAFKDFQFGDITWHNYRGTDDNSTVAIPSNKVSFFPVKAPGVFKLAWAPGESFDDVNDLGKQMYVNREIDPQESPTWVRYKLLSYPLHVCTRPEVLATGTMDATAD